MTFNFKFTVAGALMSIMGLVHSIIYGPEERLGSLMIVMFGILLLVMSIVLEILDANHKIWMEKYTKNERD